MKFSIIKHNKNGNYQDSYDGYLNHHWFNCLSNVISYTTNHEEADFSILPIVWEPNYKYDEDLNKIKFKNLIILDFLEYGCGTWSDPRYKNLYSYFGFKHEPYDGFFERELEFYKLHLNIKQYLRDKTRVYFKREMMSSNTFDDFGIKVLPVDFINTYGEYKIYTEEQFWKNKIDLLYIWGRSSQDRVRLHGTLFTQMDRFGHNMFSTEKQYDEEVLKNNRDRSFLLLHKEWYERVDFMKYQNNTRAVLDLYGAGLKCFRTIESTINTLSFKQDMSILKHAYPWIDKENCVMLANKENSCVLDEHKSCDILHYYLRGNGQSELYKLYLNSCETNLKYRNVNYINDYFLPNVISQLK